MKTHKEYCPITLASFGKWQSTQEPFCNCDYFTQTGGSSPSVQPVQPTKKQNLMKIFRCKGCYALIAVPLEQGYENIICISCDRVGLTGSMKEFIDVKSI
jgi:hypothetical protein